MDITNRFLQEHGISPHENAFGMDGKYKTFSADEKGNMIITYQEIHGHTPIFERKNGNKWAKPYIRIRYAENNMPTDENGKKIKYMTMKGSQSEIFVNGLLKYFGTRLHEINKLVIIEGEKKAFVACKYGIPAIGIQGIHNLVRKSKDALGNIQDTVFIDSFYELFKKLTSLEKIILLFDSDCRLGSNQRKASFSSAVINFYDVASRLPRVKELYFSHIKDEFNECAKGLDDLFLYAKSESQTLADDLVTINFKSKFFNFINLHQTNRIAITKYFQIDVIEKQKNTIALEFIKKCFYENEQGDGALLAKLCESEYLYDHSEKTWLRYVDGIWRREDAKQLQMNIIASEKLPKIYRTYISDVTDEGVLKLIDKKEAHLKKWAGSQNAVKFAQGYLAAQAVDFDRNPYIINLKNGSYNFDTKEFVTHSHTDRFKKQSNANFIEDAPEPTFFIKFLEDIFLGDVEIIRFVRKWIGLCLTGLTDWQSFVYCYGHGRNGKSTFFNMLKILLGSYYQSIPIDLLISKKVASHTDEYHKAQFLGARLVVPGEIPKDKFMNESMIKDLTGTDVISARFIYGSPISFQPTHKLAMFGNHKLMVKGQDEGIWRRIVLLPFEADFAGAEIKSSELIKSFENEIDNVLMWAIKGFELFKDEGLEKPLKIKQSVDEYREENDLLSDFLCEKTERFGYGVQLRELYKAYYDYCKAVNEEVYITSAKQLANYLRERGYKIEKGAKNITYVKDITLKQ